MTEYNWVKENPECNNRKKLIKMLEDVSAPQRLYPDLYIDRLIDEGVTFQKYGKWVVNPRSCDGHTHHMCSNCREDAVFDYIYEDNYKVTPECNYEYNDVTGYEAHLDYHYTYIGQKDVDIKEFLTNYCPHCGAMIKKD